MGDNKLEGEHTTQIYARVTTEERRRIEALAKAMHTNVSSVMRSLLWSATEAIQIDEVDQAPGVPAEAGRLTDRNGQQAE